MTTGDLIVIAALALIVGLIIRGMIRDRKKGHCGGCSGCCAGKASCTGCSGCPHAK
ncbi:MAG: FeoB-associated Cys-rich membrane protein [Faecousia sp.]